MIKKANRSKVRSVHHNTETITKETALKNTEMMPEFIATNGMYVPANKVKVPLSKKRSK